MLHTHDEERAFRVLTTPRMVCYGQTNAGDLCQEWYETASRNAGRRTRALRKLGYRVCSGPMGHQVTSVGMIRLTLVTIWPGSNPDTWGLPEVSVERI